MKQSSLLHTIGIGILFFVLAGVGYEAYGAYMLNHTYYYSMFSATNRWIVAWMVIATLIPVATIFLSKSFNFKNVAIGLGLGLLVSGYAHTYLKGGVIGGTGVFLLTFNTLFLMALMAIFMVGLYVVGAKVYQYIIKQKIQYWYDVLFALGFGLAIFVILNYILIICNIFHPVLVRAQLIGTIYLIVKSPGERSQANAIINQSGNFFFSSSPWVIPFALLLGLSIVYCYFGFNLSFIPYSTAWDANHAYMYVPRVRSNNYGMRLDQGPVGGSNLWMVYIAYWFSLIKPLAPGFTLAPDTVAVVMNFLSGPLSLLLGLGALRKVIEYFTGPTDTKKNEDQKDSTFFANLSFGLGWMYFLLWVMSGMGAFLVFVDNKTDLGVMSLSMLALLSGFIFLQHVGDPSQHKEREHGYMNAITLYAIISGLFFALATMAKPTAFQDILLFGLLMVGLRAGIAGIIGGAFFVIGLLGRAETMSIVYYVSKSLGLKLMGLGGLGLIGQAMSNIYKKSLQFVRPLLYWSATIVAVLLVLKGPYLLIAQAQTHTLTPGNFVKALLMTYDNKSSSTMTTPSLINKQSINFVAQTTTGDTVSTGYQAPLAMQPTINPAMCSLDALNLTKDQLFSNLPEVQGGGLVEDLGRYIGFGQRVFTDPSSRDSTEQKKYGFVRWGYHILKLFYHTPGCYSNDQVAKQLCQDQSLLVQSQSDKIEKIYANSVSGSRGSMMLSGAMAMYTTASQESDLSRQQSTIRDAQKMLVDYMQGNVIEVKKDSKGRVSIAIPYAYLTPLNVIFNWSLQNLSSYYTDIGFVWILSLLILLVGILYTLYSVVRSMIYKTSSPYYKLFVLHAVTIVGWILRWFIASGIIRYAVGLVAWTIFSNVLFVSQLIQHQSKDKEFGRAGWSLVSVLLVVFLIQTILNLFRIASQGGEGAFVRYKGNTARDQIYEFTTQGFAPVEKIVNGYRAQDVFDLQFGIYNSFMDHVRDRKDEDGVLVAGTYIQYFLDNQNNITADGLMTEFWKRGAAGDPCLAAMRLKDKKIKYMVIDPNVGSVGGSTLIDRFIARIDPATNKIVTHGSATMLAKMTRDGYLKLVSTNTIGAKYAYTMTDDEIQSSINFIPDATVRASLLKDFDTDSLLFRARLALPRYFGQEANNYFILIGTILQQRLVNSSGIGDIADIFGKVIDVNKVAVIAAKIAQKTMTGPDMVAANKDLTKDEKSILGYYIYLVQLQQSGKMQEIQQALNGLLQQSLGGGSQVMTFELTL